MMNANDDDRRSRSTASVRSSVEGSSTSTVVSSTFTFRPPAFANGFSFTSNGNSVSASEDGSNTPPSEQTRQIFVFGDRESFLRHFCQSSSLSLIDLSHLIDSSYRDILLDICQNDRVTHEIVAFVIAKIPEAARAVTSLGATPLHLLCMNENATRDIARCLIQAHPNALMERANGVTPLHVLCVKSSKVREALEILRELIQSCPESLKCRANGCLPIHIVIAKCSPKLCILLLLVDAWPESVFIHEEHTSSVLAMILIDSDIDDRDALALLAKIIEKYPEEIRRFRLGRQTRIYSPLHLVALHNPSRSVEICRLLVPNFPELVRQELEVNGHAYTPLMLACYSTNASNLSHGLEMIKFLFDAYPEAIHGAMRAVRLTEKRFVPAVLDLLAAQGQYVELASNIQRITTLDENGYLPLHIALHEGARLGAIKLLIQAAPSTLQTPTNDGNIALHEACRLGNYDVIELLVTGEYPTAQVYARNTLGELPLQVLLANGDDEQENARYLSSIFLLLRANPPTEVPMNDMDMNLVSEFASFSLHEHDD